MPTLDALQLPRIDTSVYGGTEAKKVASHLYQVEEQLRYVLGHLDEDNLSDGLMSKIESGGMSSEIRQTLDAITLRVSGQDDAMAELRVGLTGVRSTVQEQGGAISELEQRVGSIRLTVTNSDTGSTFTLKAGETTLSSGTITFTGLVNFVSKSDLSTAGRTTINGSNITAGSIDASKVSVTNLNASNITAGELNANLIKSGIIQSKSGSTTYDLTNGTIRIGSSGEPNVYIDKALIRQYVRLPGGSIGPTGIFYSEYANTWVGATSSNVHFGWIQEGLPSYGGPYSSAYNGMLVDNDEDCTYFNTGSVNILYGLTSPASIAANSIDVWDSAARVVPTSYSALRLAAMESPAPLFCDAGGGVCDGTGTCFIALDERYLAVIEPQQARRWILTDTSGGGPLWAEDGPAGATVHGAPGQTFDWLCLAAQRGTGGEYAEVCDTAQPMNVQDDIPDVLAEALQAGEQQETDTETNLLQEEIA